MRKILVVIDMQNDFIDGSLGTKEAQQIVPRVVEKMKEYDPWNIYLTRDTHYENYLDTQEGRNLPVEHCIEGTHGWQLNDAVAKAAEKATVIDKPTFGSNRLAGILMTERAQEALEIELVGLCTEKKPPGAGGGPASLFQLSMCLPRKEAMVCASLYSVSPTWFSPSFSTNSTSPSASPSEMMGAAMAAQQRSSVSVT